MSPSEVDTNVLSDTQLQSRYCELFEKRFARAPQHVLRSPGKLLMLSQEAHWELVDEAADKFSKDHSLYFGAFAVRFFRLFSKLPLGARDESDLLRLLYKYREECPRSGVAILNPSMDKVLLVRGWGKEGKWGFPKGRMEFGETAIETGIREVKEEIGLDISCLLNYKCSYTNGKVFKAPFHLYVVPNIPEDTKFAPCVKSEISAIAWVPIKDVPTTLNCSRSFQLNPTYTRYTFDAEHCSSEQYFKGFMLELFSWLKQTVEEKQHTKQYELLCERSRRDAGIEIISTK